MSARPAPAPVFGAQARSEERARRVKPRRPELKLVQQQPKRPFLGLSPRVRLFSYVAFAGVLLFGLVAFHVLLSQGQFQLQNLEKRANQEQTQYERLRLQVAQLESPSRITAEAVNRLGMVTPANVTPIAPGSSQMPRTISGATQPVQSQTTTGDQSISDDPGSWTAVKPHLSSTSGQ